MGKRSKSKRFIQQSSDSIERHSQRIPYKMTYAEAEEKIKGHVEQSSLGGV